MKLLIIFLAFVNYIYATPVSSDDPPYIYIHGGGDECDTNFSYKYNLTTANAQTNVLFTINIIVREDKDVSNALLFYFKDYVISDYLNPDESEPSRELSDYPVRVIYKDNGLVEKLQFNDLETDASYHLKTGIIRTMQMDWTQVQAGLKTDGVKEFQAAIPGRKGECQAKTEVKVDSDKEFCVNMERKFADCTHTMPNTYEKFKESTKKWHFHFDKDHAKNFHHAKIEVEDFYRADDTIYIKSGFKFEGCQKYEGQINANDLTDVEREFKPPRKTH